MAWQNWNPGTLPPAARPPAITAQPVSNPIMPNGAQYTPEQWAQMQQQNWQQWAQWQQQYQQWHQQYGAEYQKSMHAMQLGTTQPQPPIPIMPCNTGVPPPLPIDPKPPLPPDDPPAPAPPMKPTTYHPPTLPLPQLQVQPIQKPEAYPTPQSQPQYSTRSPWEQQQKRPFPSNDSFEMNANNTSKRQMMEKPSEWSQTTHMQMNPSQNVHTQINQSKNIPALMNQSQNLHPQMNQSPNIPALMNQSSNVHTQMNSSQNISPLMNHSQNLPALMNPSQNSHTQLNQSQIKLNEVWSQPPPPIKVINNEELSEAEKKFDKEFAAWEAQFNKWKEQNANHPDKAQYREYEKKWESWRNSLLERREQMRKKRLNLTGPPKSIQPPSQQVNYSQPPPQIKPKPQPDIAFNKPPPDLNNEPLSFEHKSSSSPPPQSQTQPVDDGSSFLKSATSGGIPGLDLVKEGEPGAKVEHEHENEEIAKKTANFDAISKGINTILGDQKILSMLSMVTQTQSGGADNQESVGPTSYNDQSNHSYDDRSSHNDGFKQQQQPRECVNNFDDQTRSSFTLGPNDQMQDAMGGNNFNPNPQRFEPRNKFVAPNRPMSFERDNYDNRNFKFEAKSNNRFNNSYQQNYDEYEENYGYEGQGDYEGYDEGGFCEEGYEEEGNFGYNSGRNEYDDGQEYGEGEWHDNENYEEKYDNYEEEQQGEEEELENDGLIKPPDEEPEEVAEIEEEPMFEPQKLIDYDHKSLKTTELEVLIEPIHMFDYRHKSLSRIPLPQRPRWLADTVRNIREFGPLSTRQMPYDRPPINRFPDRRPNYREEPQPLQRGRPPQRDYDYSNNRNQNYNESSTVAPPSTTNQSPQKNIGFTKNDFEELSDEEMDWGKNVVEESPQPQPTKSKVTMIEEILNPPGRHSRASRIVIILRGPPGSGKTFLAKLIKDKEVENGGSAPRILSLDDYFMVEQEKLVVEDGKSVAIKEMVYEYEAEMEESYRASLLKSFKKTITDGYFPFIIVDNINEKVKYFGEMWSFAKQSGFQVYICELDLDPQVCSKRNIHGRSEKEIEDYVAGWDPVPSHHPILDASGLLATAATIAEVEMEEVAPVATEKDVEEVVEGEVTSKWDNFDCSRNNLARLDGVSKPLRSSQSMEEYLQMDAVWEQNAATAKAGQKRVRWADLEEQKQQAKMRAIGFVVGQTNWDKMMDPTSASSALTQTKYIERVKRY